MLSVFLRNESRHPTEPYDRGFGNRIDDRVSELGVYPSVRVASDDECGCLDLSVLDLVEISFVDRACQRQKMLCPILANEWREIARDELHWHVLGIGHASSEHALQ